LHAQKILTAGGLQGKNELPHLVWASDAQEFRLATDALGLVMYAATVPHLFPTKDILPDTPGVNMLPWALGNALFLRFERDGGAQ
jgi:hypothetical protein